MEGVFSHWLCPHCKTHLSMENVCLNLCGLSRSSAVRFNNLLAKVLKDTKHE